MPQGNTIKSTRAGVVLGTSYTKLEGESRTTHTLFLALSLKPTQKRTFLVKDQVVRSLHVSKLTSSHKRAKPLAVLRSQTPTLHACATVIEATFDGRVFFFALSDFFTNLGGSGGIHVD